MHAERTHSWEKGDSYSIKKTKKKNKTKANSCFNKKNVISVSPVGKLSLGGRSSIILCASMYYCLCITSYYHDDQCMETL